MNRRLLPSISTLITGYLCAVATLGQESPPKPAAVSAEPTVFQEVTAKLDAGGCLYAYLSTDQWLGGLSAQVARVREFVLALPDLEGEDRAMVERGFKLGESLVRNSGLESLAGVGLSGIAVEKGFYRTRFVAQRAPGSGGGYGWQWFGTQPHALAALDWLPADTVWAMFGDLDLKAIWTAVEREAGEAGLDPLREALKELSANVEAATGRSLAAQLDSMAGEIGLALVLDPATTFKMPLPGGEQEFPEPSLLVAFKVKDDQLFDWVNQVLAENPQSTRGDADGARWRSLSIPVPVPFPLRPTIGRAGDYLWVASSDVLFERVRKTKAGATPGLKSTAEFQRLARNLPTTGNSFNFMSARLSETLAEIQKAVLQQAAREQGGGAFPVELFQRLMGLAENPAALAIGWSDASGMQSVSQGNQEPSTVLVSSAVVAPTAVMAGMLLPALAKAKSRAQDVMCANNLKQIALGIHMYANDHEDVLPKDLASLKEYLGGAPMVLFCPQDPQRPDPGTMTWDKIEPGRSSYEFLKPGVKLPDLDPAEVIARCKIHGHEARGDGSVHQAGR